MTPPATTGTSRPAGDTSTISSGMAAPTVKVAAEVSAAWIGRAVVASEIPSSSRACAPRRVLGHQLQRHLRAPAPGSRPRLT